MEQTQEEALTDPLTALPNMRYMFIHLARELACAERLKTELSLLVTHLDNLKKINDTYGHRVRNCALRDVARVLRTGIRIRHLRPVCSVTNSSLCCPDPVSQRRTKSKWSCSS